MTTSAKRLLDDGIPSNVSKLRADYRLGTSISDIWTPTGLVRADRSMLFENIETNEASILGVLHVLLLSPAAMFAFVCCETHHWRLSNAQIIPPHLWKRNHWFKLPIFMQIYVRWSGKILFLGKPWSMGHGFALGRSWQGRCLSEQLNKTQQHAMTKCTQLISANIMFGLSARF